MENITFQTPAGHTVTVQPTLNYPQKRRIQRLYFSGAKVNAQTGEYDFDLGVQIDVQDMLLKIMVQRIQLTTGKMLEGPEAVFNGLAELADPDIRAIYDKLDELTASLNIFPSRERGEKGTA